MSVAERVVQPAGSTPGRRLALGELVRADPWRYLRLELFVAYGVGYVVWFKTKGIVLDRISVLLSVLILIVIANVGRPLHRWGRAALDFSVYGAMWIAYDESRGIADRLGFPLQVESVINIDRLLFFGTHPTVWMQQHFYQPAAVRWYDVAGSIVYFSHFVVPPAVMAILWMVNRREWVRFIKRFATTMFVACTMFIVLPTAPPWMAAGGSAEIRLDALPPLARPTTRGWGHLGLKGFVHTWDTVKDRDWANKVAAMPSLHCAYALLIVAFFLPWIRPLWLKAAVMLFPLSMAASLVYFAEHYVVDALAGWAIVGVSFLAWNRIERRQRERRLEVTERALAAPATWPPPP